MIIAILAPPMIITNGDDSENGYALKLMMVFLSCAEGSEMKMAVYSITNTDIRATQRVLVAVTIMQIATIKSVVEIIDVTPIMMK